MVVEFPIRGMKDSIHYVKPMYIKNSSVFFFSYI